jgi:hypothetical protein
MLQKILRFKPKNHHNRPRYGTSYVFGSIQSKVNTANNSLEYMVTTESDVGKQDISRSGIKGIFWALPILPESHQSNTIKN